MDRQTLIEMYFVRTPLPLVEDYKPLTNDEVHGVMKHHGFTKEWKGGHWQYNHPSGAIVNVGDQHGKPLGPALISKPARHLANELQDDDYAHPDNWDPTKLAKVEPGEKAYKSPFNPKHKRKFELKKRYFVDPTDKKDPKTHFGGFPSPPPPSPEDIKKRLKGEKIKAKGRLPGLPKITRSISKEGLMDLEKTYDAHKAKEKEYIDRAGPPGSEPKGPLSRVQLLRRAKVEMKRAERVRAHARHRH